MLMIYALRLKVCTNKKIYESVVIKKKKKKKSPNLYESLSNIHTHVCVLSLLCACFSLARVSGYYVCACVYVMGVRKSL